MSTKTTFKRIALVAVATLAMGGLSVVPANALNPNALVTSVSLATVTAAPTAGTAVKVNFGAITTSATVTSGSTVAFTAYLSSYPSASFTQVAAVLELAAGSAASLITGATTAGISGSTYSHIGSTTTVGGNTVVAGATTGFGSFSFTPANAGVYVLNVWNDANADSLVAIGEAVQTISITVVAATGLSAPRSSAWMTEPSANGATANSVTNAVARSASKTVNTGISQVLVTLLNADGTAATAAHSVIATVSGAGYVSVNTSANTPGSPATRTATDFTGASLRYVHINSDGTAGAGTVTVSVTDAVTLATSVLGTFKYTSYGSATAISIAKTNYTIGAASGAVSGDGTATTRSATIIAAFVVKEVDATGAVASQAVPTIVSSNTLVVASGTCAVDDGLSLLYSSGGTGFYNCSFTTSTSAVSGQTATLTARIVDPANALLFLTTTYVVTIGGAVATETLSLDKTSYAPGEAMVVTRTAKDLAGNPVADATASPIVSFNKAVGGAAQQIAVGAYIGGVSATSAKAPSVFAPVSTGAFLASMTSGNTAASVVTATANIADATGDATTAAAEEATAAANDATDAALSAAEAAEAATAIAQEAVDAVAELSASVTKLISALRAQITTLTNLVVKIQKKVKA